MLVLVIVLVVTNVIALGALLWLRLQPAEPPELDASVAGSLSPALRPPSSTSGTRRFITIEILNPIELAGSRGRWAGIAGSLAPGITRRIVYDQALKTVRRHLSDEDVVADVRLHVIRPVEAPPRRPPASRAAAAGAAAPGAAASRPAQPPSGVVAPDSPVDLVKPDGTRRPPAG